MSARKAKQIRKLLRNIVEGEMHNGKTFKDVSYVEREANRKMAMVPMGAGKEPMLQVVAPGTRYAATDSVRGVYLALKKGLKKHRSQ